MKTLGFPVSHKENENRRALVPSDCAVIANKQMIWVEKGYGQVLNICDEEYLEVGIKIGSREEILSKDIICDPKIGDAEYLSQLHNQTIFGWVHAVRNREIADTLIERKLTAYAWEDMFEGGRHCFWRNNEIAGEAAVFHASICHGVFPHGLKVAVIGRGNTARGAIKMLTHLGADIMVYDRKSQGLLREELGMYDVVVNAVLWDTARKDHLIYREDLSKMKKGAMLIDISCDREGAIETSVPTSIANPTYYVNGILHYVVDHTPSLFYKTTSESLSHTIAPFLDSLISECPTKVLSDALIVDQGQIIDRRIIEFQGR